jgi:hypothetical protein
MWNLEIKSEKLNLILIKPVDDQEIRTLSNRAIISEVGIDVIGYRMERSSKVLVI